jgi:hypothetical protein
MTTVAPPATTTTLFVRRLMRTCARSRAAGEFWPWVRLILGVPGCAGTRSLDWLIGLGSNSTSRT